MDIKKMVPWKRDKAIAEQDPFKVLRRQMNSLFDDFFSNGSMTALEGFTPRVDIKDTGKEIRVTADLPGMEEKDLEISLGGDMLTIKGERKEEKEEKGEERYCLERSYGAFRRSFALPCDVDPNKAAAAYKKGVLTITLPKTAAAAAATKKIAVKAA
jgi:HSP20 family protein